MRFPALDNLPLKLVSLVLGFSLWYIVAGGQGTEMVVPVPLEYRNVPEGLEVIEESVQQADIRLRGSSEILRRISPQEIQVGVDLSGAQPGEQSIYLAPDQVVVPFGVRVMRVTPATIKLQLDETSRRNVHIVPRVVGSPASGFELVNIWLGSPEIEVSGPASRLANLEQVTTEPLSVEGLREPYTQTVQVMLEDPYARLVDVRGVEVTLDVREERVRREMTGLVLHGQPASVKVSFTPSFVMVQIEGPRSVVEQLRAEDLEARVILQELSPGVHRLPLQIVFRREGFSGVEILATEPEEVHARILASQDGRDKTQMAQNVFHTLRVRVFED